MVFEDIRNVLKGFTLNRYLPFEITSKRMQTTSFRFQILLPFLTTYQYACNRNKRILFVLSIDIYASRKSLTRDINSLVMEKSGKIVSCSKCGSRLSLCGEVVCPIIKRVEGSLERKLDSKRLFEASPPSVFIGS